MVSLERLCANQGKKKQKNERDPRYGLRALALLRNCVKRNCWYGVCGCDWGIRALHSVKYRIRNCRSFRTIYFKVRMTNLVEQGCELGREQHGCELA